MKKNKRVPLTKKELLERVKVIQQFKLKPVDKSLHNTN